MACSSFCYHHHSPTSTFMSQLLTVQAYARKPKSLATSIQEALYNKVLQSPNTAAFGWIDWKIQFFHSNAEFTKNDFILNALTLTPNELTLDPNTWHVPASVTIIIAHIHIHVPTNHSAGLCQKTKELSDLHPRSSVQQSTSMTKHCSFRMNRLKGSNSFTVMRNSPKNDFILNALTLTPNELTLDPNTWHVPASVTIIIAPHPHLCPN